MLKSSFAKSILASEKMLDYLEVGGLSSDSESLDDDALRSVDAFSSDSDTDEFDIPEIEEDGVIPSTPQIVFSEGNENVYERELLPTKSIK